MATRNRDAIRKWQSRELLIYNISQIVHRLFLEQRRRKSSTICRTFAPTTSLFVPDLKNRAIYGDLSAWPMLGQYSIDKPWQRLFLLSHERLEKVRCPWPRSSKGRIQYGDEQKLENADFQCVYVRNIRRKTCELYRTRNFRIIVVKMFIIANLHNLVCLGRNYVVLFDSCELSGLLLFYHCE